MRNYLKPLVVVNDELAEGVYAASGNVTEPNQPTTGSVSVTGVSIASEGNQWNKVNTYKVTIANSTSEDKADWTVAISVISGTATDAKINNGWLASAYLNGSTITITPGGGGAIPAGGSIEVEVVVSYSSDSITVG